MSPSAHGPRCLLPMHSNPESRPEPPRVNISFTPDSRTLVFSTFPSQAESDQAKRAAAQKKSTQTPKGGIAIMDLASGAVVRMPQVRSFQVPESGTGYIAWQREPKTVAGSAEPKPDAELPQDSDQSRRRTSSTARGC